MNKTVAALAAALTLTACGMDSMDVEQLQSSSAAASSKTTKPVAGPTYALKTSDAHTAGVTPTWKTSYPVSSTLQIFFSTEITGTLSGHHAVTVFVNAPG